MNHENVYPIQKLIPLLKQTLNLNNITILSAPPGAGKTTIIPPSLIDEPWLNKKKIIMLEPRRIAARCAAEFMAEMRMERCGETIGYRIRTETVVSSKTRIEVVTEGILTRMIQSDIELPEAGLIIFDEFHERSIHADIGLAFLLDVQRNIRNDIKILIMSATPDLKKISDLLNNPPLVRADGKMYPVTTHYLKQNNDKPVEIKTTEAIITALRKEDGDILVFLPGKKEIKRTGNLLFEKYNDSKELAIHELYGESSRDQQNAALKPDNRNKRKVILATSLAETSLTIDGIRIVIDSGLSRLPSYNIRRGMPGLVTVPVSKASADQRRGRAGRQQEGICYRLWTMEEEKRHPDFSVPEILSTDLTQFALELAKWGTPNGEGLLFIDPPPPLHLKKALSILNMLGAIDSNNKLTSFGLQMAELPAHPRLSAMIVKAKECRLTYQACLLAALLEEREITRSGNNLAVHLNCVLDNTISTKRIVDQSNRLYKLTNEKNKDIAEQKTGVLLSFAYPDRLAKRKNEHQYQLVNGTVAVLPQGSSLVNEDYLVIAEIDGSDAAAKIFLATGITKQEILDVFESSIQEDKNVFWENDLIRGIRNFKIGAISIRETEFIPSEKETSQCMLQFIQTSGLQVLPWSKEAVSFRQRSEWYRNNMLSNNTEWPILTDEHLLKNLGSWLLPFLPGITKRKELNNLNTDQIIRSLFAYKQISLLDMQVPDSIKVPGGSTIKLKYDQGNKPVLGVRIQELFGQHDTPGICNGKVPVLIHLLSPAMRPLAITQDLKSFWTNAYPELLNQMRVKYPKHFWPDNPMLAHPTNKTKKRIK